jgi:hypothetical protein
VDRVGAGPVLEGHPTTEYQYAQSVSYVGADGRTIVSRSQTVIHFYFPQNLPNFSNPLLVGSAYLNPLGIPEEFMRPVRAATSKLPHPLSPLRSESRTETRDGAGKIVGTSATTFEVKHLTRTDVPSSLFAIPTDFGRIPAPVGTVTAQQQPH